jgi:hypothetical protein
MLANARFEFNFQHSNSFLSTAFWHCCYNFLQFFHLYDVAVSRWPLSSLYRCCEKCCISHQCWNANLNLRSAFGRYVTTAVFGSFRLRHVPTRNWHTLISSSFLAVYFLCVAQWSIILRLKGRWVERSFWPVHPESFLRKSASWGRQQYSCDKSLWHQWSTGCVVQSLRLVKYT